jgi:hypothetical protein
MTKFLLVALLLTGAAWGQDANKPDANKPTPIVASLIMSWEMQNDACQGGDQQACRFRDAELLSIESQGWCLSGAKKWQPAPCKPADTNPGTVFIKKLLTDSCTKGVTEACEIRDENDSVEHFERLEEFLDDYCAEDGSAVTGSDGHSHAGPDTNPTTAKACVARDAVLKSLEDHGYHPNHGGWDRGPAKKLN